MGIKPALRLSRPPQKHCLLLHVRIDVNFNLFNSVVLILSMNNKGFSSFKDKLISAVGCFFLVIKPLFFLARIMRVHFRNMANTNKQKKNHSSFTSLYVHICNIQRDSCLSKYDIPLFFCNLFSFCILSHQKLIFVFYKSVKLFG